MVPKPKDVLPLAQEITELEKKLADAKRRWNTLFGIEETPRRGRQSSADTLASKVQTFIDDNEGGDFTISAVAKAVGGDEMAVGRSLYRLARLGKINNPARGKYCALTSYPSDRAGSEGESLESSK